MALEELRQSAENHIAANFGKEFDRVYDSLGNSSMSESRKNLGAGRLALERAVLRTALERGVAPHILAEKLGQPGREPITSQLIQKGREDIKRAFGQEPSSVVAILAGKTSEIDLPKGLSMTDDVRRVVSQGKKMYSEILLDQYSNRGNLQIDSERRGSVVGQVQGEKLPQLKEKLVNHMLFVNSAIDHGVKTGKLSPDDGKFLQENVEKMVFQPAEQPGLSQPLKDFQKNTAPRVRDEILRSVADRSQAPAIENAVDKLYDAQGIASPYHTQSKPAQDKGQPFAGKVVDVDAKHVYQELGKNNIVRHERSAFAQAPEKGKFTKIQYDAGKAQVVDKGQSQGQKLSLAR